MQVAVTGATGYLGHFVLADLLARGCRIRAWAHAHREPVPGITWVPGDLDDPASMRRLIEGVEALVHLAYQHAPGRYRGGEGDDLAGYLQANLMGSLRLLQTAFEAGVSRCVVLSTRAVYPRGITGRQVTETEAARPDTHYGAHKLALEAFVSSFAAQQGWHVAALRPTGIYGLVRPLERTKWFELVRDVVAGRAITTVRGATEVHGADVASAIWLLLTGERAAGGIYNCSDLVVTTREIAELAQLASGASGPLPPEPETGPSSLMDTSRLRGLGWRPGGRDRLETTVRDLTHAIARAA